MTLKNKSLRKIITLIIITILLCSLLVIGVTLNQRRSQNQGLGQSMEEAEGLPYEKCMCWSGLSATSGHCIASEACE